jgi:hypothetical protein
MLAAMLASMLSTMLVAILEDCGILINIKKLSHAPSVFTLGKEGDQQQPFPHTPFGCSAM